VSTPAEAPQHHEGDHGHTGHAHHADHVHEDDHHEGHVRGHDHDADHFHEDNHVTGHVHDGDDRHENEVQEDDQGQNHVREGHDHSAEHFHEVDDDEGRVHDGDDRHTDHFHEVDHVAGHVHDDDHAAAHGRAHTHAHANAGLRSTLEHFFQPHSHDAADSLDTELVGSRAGIRAVQLSLIGLAFTAAFQLAVALASGSVAVLADTIHNFADASTAIPLWLAFKVSSKPANTRYTYGYGRAEDLAGVFVLLMILSSAAVALWESLQKLINPTPIDHLGWVAVAGLAGFVGNELVAQYRIRVGQRIGSAALVADGYHARTDGLTSLAVLLGAAGVWLGFPIADPLIGLLITVAIVLVLKDSAIQMWRRLMDAVEPSLVEQAAEAAASAEGVRGVSAVRARWIGHTIHAEALIVADAGLSLGEAHGVAERARHAMLHAVPRLSSVTVHVDPSEDNGLDHHAELAHHDRR
jgi:cation diffusion facilitator family transporter